MAKKKSASTQSVAETVTVSLNNQERKHVALDQLHIIKKYIDDKNNTQDGRLITDEAGVYGLRFYNKKLQVRDTNGAWVDIVLESGGSGEGGGETCKAGIADDKDVSNLFEL